MLAIVVHAMADGTWSRLKSCTTDACRWAFYDRSRARSGEWWSMGSAVTAPSSSPGVGAAARTWG
jgi:predicted RNA-binding Zn ribbon-like protein